MFLCETCPFTCKDADVCVPHQLKNQLTEFLPTIIEKQFDKEPTITKPNILFDIEIDGKEYYF